MKKQDFDIICRKCKETVAGEVSDRGHVCHKTERVLKAPSFLSEEEKALQWKLEHILLEFANDHRIEHHGDVEGWVLPSVMNEILGFSSKQRSKWYYVGLFDGFEVDEYGEKRTYTQTDVSLRIHFFKERILEKLNKLFVHTFEIPPLKLINRLWDKEEVIKAIKEEKE